MSNPNTAIRVKDISKLYRIGMKQEMHDNLMYSLWEFVKRPLSNYRKYRSLYKFDDVLADTGKTVKSISNNVIWSLRNVSFDVKQGERIGIIGRNGAGKSTLLKVLSRITTPTQGDIEIHGRISSLLEVGTGFHPELTGRENVYLNGTVLGMRKHEVDQKYERIVEFAGTGKFIDTPVKRYSSGMKVRLAFSVAAHLEPEILIVDEVLAVGDANFQNKCLQKMDDAGQEGRTVLFVSHNMAAIARLCDRTLLIEDGRIVSDGPTDKVVSEYLSSGLVTPSSREWNEDENAPGNSIARLKSARILNKGKKIIETVDIREPVLFEMTYDVMGSGYKLLPHFGLNNYKHECIFKTLDQDKNWRKKNRPPGRYTNTVWIPGNLLADGLYFLTCALLTQSPDTLVFNTNNVVSFNIVDSYEGDSARGDYHKSMPGIIRPLLEWETSFEPH